MALSTEQRDRITQLLDELSDRRVPIAVRDQVVLQYRIDRNAVVLFLKRRGFRDPGRWTESGVAKFRFVGRSGLWTLLWRDRNSKWHLHETAPSEDIADLIVVVDEDRTGIFWG